MRLRAPAKLNLFLEVLAREESGFHQLETLFCALELADELELESAGAGDGIALLVNGADVGPPERNLVQRAADAYAAALGRPMDVRITLRKHIPVGAGLGGGSSDAAAALIGLNRLHHERVSRDLLLEIGAGLGSDVPFFLCGSPLALAWGRGGRLLPLEPLPAANVVVAVPAEAMATADAFAALATARAGSSGRSARVLRSDHLCSWADVARLARNDFEGVVLEHLADARDARELLAEQGASIARLTGSGSAVYGIFADATQARRAAHTLTETLPAVRVLVTRTASPPQPLPFG